MPDSIASFIYIYADDAKLFMTGRDQAMLLKDLDMLGEWSQIWHLRFNVDKCKVMRVGKPVEREPYVMQGVNGISCPLQAVEVEMDLGVWISLNSLITLSMQ